MTDLFKSARRAMAIVAIATAPAAAQDLGIALGEQAPGGPLETLAGQTVDLSAYLGKQQPTLIEFWATWCPNCKQLEPALRAAHAKHGKAVRFVTVAVSVNQSVERVKAWQAANKMPGDILYDRKGTVSGAYDVPATSYIVVADKTGKIVYTGVGGTQNIEAALKKAM
ncbi:TlpA disulfide reductase family protein [Gemmatimonas sp.]|jgi:peroxiredoxin|uniref:TlpA family protein disulfide reductase n=1 Tax=Gemmatimonas sp. TaxID=1962908 RepID=UPI0022BCA91F|nr:TlpA disulfide reductase family protein [Gemmatimonas sp.]MCA2984261.1 TlpA family protein disulfide reductase [Gemmatimonas sp.]MCA2986382.1 TlpA family protein disulfide reductase [Gemmatimonas sp.]MCA2990779.1 TlpA family protein disulfide reductase [Gemmatimonas sp.]MCA2995010.1 TlpA family protein disulfide reductase [Gemmatimonas sp.]MCE2955004.1 TlpA family protein disulfide reductase [Gemmatimonas sp.]